MRGNEFLDKMELIDPAYVEAAEASPVRKKKSPFVKWGAIAACFCLVAVMVPGLLDMQSEPSGPPVPSPDGTIQRTEEPPEGSYNQPILRPGDPGYIEPGEPIQEDVYNGLFVPYGTDVESSLLDNVKPMISGSAEAPYEGDMAVHNGYTHMSQALEDALGKNGDVANYRVFVVLFKDGVQINSGSEAALKEAKRLSDLGYVVAIEWFTQTIGEGEYEVECYFTIHGTYEQMSDFAASEDFGYAMMLYNEYFGISSEPPVVFHGVMQ